MKLFHNKRLTAIFIAVFGGFSFIQAELPIFEAHTFAEEGGGAWAQTDFGDIDGDGDLDYMSGNWSNLYWWENPGDGRDNIINCGENAVSIIEQIGSDWVKLNYDFGNVISHCFEKLRPEQDYKHAQPHTAHYHIKDVASDESGWHFTEIGKGTIDYRTILKELGVEPVPKPLSLEIPLRVSRARDASPRRAASRVDLEEIRRAMKGSLNFVRNLLSS